MIAPAQEVFLCDAPGVVVLEELAQVFNDRVLALAAVAHEARLCAACLVVVPELLEVHSLLGWGRRLSVDQHGGSRPATEVALVPLSGTRQGLKFGATECTSDDSPLA